MQSGIAQALCWQGSGRESKCLGSSPCPPQCTQCKAGSAAFALCHLSHSTLTGIQTQARASVSTALRLGPRLLLEKGEWLIPQLFPKLPKMRGHKGGRDEPLQLTQAWLGQPPPA